MQFLSAQRRNDLVGRYIPFTKQVIFEQHMIDSFKSSGFQNSKLCQEKPHCFARNDIARHAHMFAFHHGKSTVLVIWNPARANDNPGEYRLQTDNKRCTDGETLFQPTIFGEELFRILTEQDIVLEYGNIWQAFIQRLFPQYDMAHETSFFHFAQ
ncbi:Uncharacterised protein [Neisseria elongata subsp. glycolytica]|nr:Uncharacterised protein [Neisseria elongata subsp. glycolytica]